MFDNRVDRALYKWLRQAAVAWQPFLPVISYEAIAELREENARHEASRRAEEQPAFPMR